tara:strand:+ start:6410 stop:7186 length:777 start_codon:yes stop_codon:yes gene_type:complete
MAIKLTSTRDAQADSGLKVAIHGPAGSGKTTMIASADEPTIIISAEGGLLSLRHYDIPVIIVTSMAEIEEAYSYIAGPDGAQYKWVGIDSASEIAEVCLNAEKITTTDGRRAYGEMQDKMMGMLRAFRDLPKNVVMTFKQSRVEDGGSGLTLHSPMMPGRVLTQQVPYLFDEVLALRVERNEAGEFERWAQTARDMQYDAKDRSGALDAFEPPNLGAIAAKIRGEAPPVVEHVTSTPDPEPEAEITPEPDQEIENATA